MAQLFRHEKLKVYQKGLGFAVKRKRLLDGLPRRVAACDHLDRGSESILVNIAHASSSWSPQERIVYLGHACGSALECAACLDVFVAKRLLMSEDAYPGKSLLAEIVSMLVRMRETSAERVHEDHAPYCTKRGNLFSASLSRNCYKKQENNLLLTIRSPSPSGRGLGVRVGEAISHENLDVYQAELQLVSWVESASSQFACSSDLLSKLDKSTTSIVLNTAEGNGRFTGADQVKFLGIAYKATVHSASLVDLATTEGGGVAPSWAEEGRNLLRRIAAMLTSLSKSVGDDT